MLRTSLMPLFPSFNIECHSLWCPDIRTWRSGEQNTNMLRCFNDDLHLKCPSEGSELSKEASTRSRNARGPCVGK
jgi:hypothetical protein